MISLLSHPLRLLPNGSIAALHEGSDAYLAERLAVILMTAPGERPLVPFFGINDPTYSNLDLAALSGQIRTWNVPVEVRSVTTTTLDEARVQYDIEFDTVERT